jgi:hypothetical protein
MIRYKFIDVSEQSADTVFSPSPAFEGIALIDDVDNFGAKKAASRTRRGRGQEFYNILGAT